MHGDAKVIYLIFILLYDCVVCSKFSSMVLNAEFFVLIIALLESMLVLMCNICCPFLFKSFINFVSCKVKFGFMKKFRMNRGGLYRMHKHKQLTGISLKFLSGLVAYCFMVAACTGNSRHKRENKDDYSLEKLASPVLVNEIDAFLAGRHTDDSLKIILVDVHDSLLYICPSAYYDGRESVGYSFYKGKLVGFYINGFAGNWDFVDTARLEKRVTREYPDAYIAAFDSLEYKYDYRVRTYQIHSKDSLNLVFWGYY